MYEMFCQQENKTWKNDSFRIGKSIDNQVTVMWENEWYITDKDYIYIIENSNTCGYQ